MSDWIIGCFTYKFITKHPLVWFQVIAETLSEEEIAGLKEMFKMIDADGSGQITLEELKKGLEKVGANIKDSKIVHLMEAVKLSLQSHCFHLVYMI